VDHSLFTKHASSSIAIFLIADISLVLFFTGSTLHSAHRACYIQPLSTSKSTSLVKPPLHPLTFPMRFSPTIDGTVLLRIVIRGLVPLPSPPG